MSLPRVSFLEGWERSPAALRGRDESDSELSSHDLPENASVSSSFPSTYTRLNFNPYAGPGWTESAEDHPSGSLARCLSPTSARDSVERPASPAVVSFGGQSGPVKEPLGWSETTSAFEVSPAKRIVQVCLAVVYCFLAAGVVFGFAALKPVLLQEDVYRELCSPGEVEDNVSVCAGQEIQLNLMFTIAAVATNVVALPVGTILDAYGPRVCGFIGSILLAIGSAVFAFAQKLPFDGYVPGYLLLALGGPFIFLSSFHLSNAFVTRSGLILSMLTGAFDASSALFLIFRLLNQATNGYVSIRTFFLAYLAVPALIAMAQFTMPNASYKTAGELMNYAEEQAIEEINDRVDSTIDDHNEGERQRNSRRTHRQSIVHQIQDLFDDRSSAASVPIVDDAIFTNDSTNTQPNNTPKPAALPPNAPNPNISGVWGALHGQSALSQLRTPWFVLITLTTTLLMLRINFLVATLRQQYSYLLSPEEASQINTVFDIILPVGGLLSIPFIGGILDKLKMRTVLAILVSIATFIGILGCIPHSRAAAYANIVLFVLYRPFYYTTVSDYAAKVFGFQTFGKVYGLIICVAGIGNFAQAGLDTLTLKVFDRNPIPVNAGLTVLVAVVGSALVAFVSYQTSVMAKNQVNEPIAVQSESSALGAAVRDWERQPLLNSENGGQRTYGS